MSIATYWLNGALLSAAEAVVPITDHGLLYGDGVFEGIRFYRGRAFRLAAHLARLQASARALCLELPYDSAVLTTAVAEVVAAHVAAGGGDDGYLRLVVTRGHGPLGLDPTGCTTPNVFMIAAALGLVDAEARRRGIRLVTAAVRRPGPDVIDPRIKSLNYLNNVFAKLAARHAGADEALLLNAAGYVVEGTAENVFVVRNGAVFTPPVSDGALDGITRGVVIELCASLGIALQERSLTPYDVYTAEECFLCGTGAELIPVRSLDGRVLPTPPGMVFTRLAAAFETLTREV